MDEGELNPDVVAFYHYKQWVKSLRCSFSTSFVPEELVNCRSFAEILHRIDGEYFYEDWVEKIVDYDKDTSFRLKANNLDKLLKRMTLYLAEFASRAISIKGNNIWKIDDQNFVEQHEYNDLNKILCLIVGCALMGRNNAEFVNLIQQQQPDLQVFVANCVKHINEHSEEQAKNTPSSRDDNEHTFVSNGGGDYESDKLKQEVEDLKHDKERLESELQSTKQKLYEYTNNKSADILESENHELRKRKQELDDRVIDMEITIETMKGKLEVKDEELESFRDKMANIHAFEEEYRRMKDEVGELKNKELELGRVSRELESLKQRNKDASFDKSELIVLREKANQYLRDLVDFEEEKSRSKVLRQQLASVKAQKEELEGLFNKNTIRLAKFEADLAEAKGKLASAERKNDDLVSERIELQGRIRELEVNPTRESLSSLSNLGSELETTRSMEDFNDKFRILSLEREVARLQEDVKQFEALQGEQREWQRTKDINRELESKYQIAQEKINELHTHVASLENMLQNPQANVDVSQLRIDLEKRSIEINTVKERADSFEKKLNKAEEDKKRIEEKNAELQNILEQRDVQLRTAKQLLTDQEHKLATSEDGGPTVHQMDVMKKDLEVKQKKIENLEEQLEKLTLGHEEEMRLVTSSYHGMVQTLSDSLTEGRVRARDRLKSFLTRQLNARF